jgi:hypothetical protein
MRATALVAIAAAMLSASCADSVTSPSGADNGALNVFLAYSPYPEARALLVTVGEVTAHRAGNGEAAQLPIGPVGTPLLRTCDLNRVENAQTIIGSGPLPAGDYTQLRVVVLAAALYFDNPSTGPACAPTIPAPAGRRVLADLTSGDVRINQPFDIVAAGNASIVINFDGARSITNMGNGSYRMTPVIGVVSVN